MRLKLILLGLTVAAVATGAVFFHRFQLVQRWQDAVGRSQPDSLPEIHSLLKQGVDIRTRGHGGSTVLWVAAYWGDPDLLQQALDAGIDPNEGDPAFGDTPLMGATFALTSEPIQKLLKAGADVNRQSKSGETALLLAVRNARHDLIPLLLEAGAKVDVANVKGETPLSLARGLTRGGLHPMRPDLTTEDFVRLLQAGKSGVGSVPRS